MSNIKENYRNFIDKVLDESLEVNAISTTEMSSDTSDSNHIKMRNNCRYGKVAKESKGIS
jgi:hypothetical protein